MQHRLHCFHCTGLRCIEGFSTVRVFAYHCKKYLTFCFNMMVGIGSINIYYIIIYTCVEYINNNDG